MKNTLKLLTLSLALFTSVAHSTNVIITDNDILPKAVANLRGSADTLTQACERYQVNHGIAALSQGDIQKAFTFFCTALGDYGSPLGYLYASALEEDDVTAIRYQNIADNAHKAGAISDVTFSEHNAWLGSLSFIE